jgi:hypothetical protein
MWFYPQRHHYIVGDANRNCGQIRRLPKGAPQGIQVAEENSQKHDRTRRKMSRPTVCPCGRYTANYHGPLSVFAQLLVSTPCGTSGAVDRCVDTIAPATDANRRRRPQRASHSLALAQSMRQARQLRPSRQSASDWNSVYCNDLDRSQSHED